MPSVEVSWIGVESATLLSFPETPTFLDVSDADCMAGSPDRQRPADGTEIVTINACLSVVAIPMALVRLMTTARMMMMVSGHFRALQTIAVASVVIAEAVGLAVTVSVPAALLALPSGAEAKNCELFCCHFPVLKVTG